MEIGLGRRTQVVTVGAGKGGVGKTTITLGLAVALRDMGVTVGVLDADVFGPNLPEMLGRVRTTPASHWTLASRQERALVRPLEMHGLQVMSIGFFLGESQSIAWGGPLVEHTVGQLIDDVDWGDVDILLIDLPPGTGEVALAILQTVNVSGAVVVVTPADAAHLDAKKALDMFAHAGVPVFGGVENMASLQCPDCGSEITLFEPPPPERAIWAAELRRLGSVPMVVDRGISKVGGFVSLDEPSGALRSVFGDIAKQILDDVRRTAQH